MTDVRSEKSRDHTGAAFALVAAILFGASTPAAKLMVGTTDPWFLAGLLYLGSGIGLAVVRAIAKDRLSFPLAHEAPLHGKDWAWLAGATVFGGIVGPVLLMFGLAKTSASASSLLLNLESVFTALLAWFAFRENFDRRIALGMLMIFSGSVLLTWCQDLSLSGILGPLCIVGASLAWAIDNNLTKQIAASDALQIAMTKGLAAGIVNSVLAATVTATLPDARSALFAGLIGFFGYGVSLLFFVLALRHVGAARTGAYFSLAPFVGAAIALAIGEDAPGWTFAFAAALMAGGVWLHLSERHDHEHVHPIVEHSHRHQHDEHHRHVHDSADPPGEPHSHRHRHAHLVHKHPHFPDAHHMHAH